MLFGLNRLCLFKRISISIRRKIANGFLDGKVRSAETFHSRKYHQFYNKKKNDEKKEIKAQIKQKRLYTR